MSKHARIVINKGKGCLGQVLQWVGIIGLLPSFGIMSASEDGVIGEIVFFVFMSLTIAGFALVNISSNCSNCETFIKSKRVKICPKCKAVFDSGN
ncbi:MAG: hypothetical protein VX428_10480 [Verrucomicrobiota bacterium]|jgi:hypothetical protein|nr:hypothetical protein [Verrucomicrobiota bacterium]|tara:strand:+ start:186 stop:470 length:285 start_codon:yes stop_codon:yes gene_type:complete